MAREKGASAMDKAAHLLYDNVVMHADRRTVCQRCGSYLGTVYHEERLYSVGCCKCETITLVKARTPHEAARKVGIAPLPAKEQTNRITDHLPGGGIYVKSETGTEGTGVATTQRRLPEILAKLAAYEDTNLAPEEVAAIQAQLERLYTTMLL